MDIKTTINVGKMLHLVQSRVTALAICISVLGAKAFCTKCIQQLYGTVSCTLKPLRMTILKTAVIICSVDYMFCLLALEYFVGGVSSFTAKVYSLTRGLTNVLRCSQASR